MGVRLFAALLEPHPPDPDFGPYVDLETVFWPARFLIIEETKDGAFLIAFDRRGHFAGDNWSADVEAAKGQATSQYGDRVGNWEDIPSEVGDFATSGLARLALK